MATEKQLQDYYQIIKPKDLIGGYQQSSVYKKNAPENQAVFEKAMDLIVNSDRTGAYTFAEIVNKLKEFVGAEDGGETVNQVLQVYSDTPPPSDAPYGQSKNYAKISKVMAEPQDTGTQVGVILSNSPYVSLNLRHMNHVTTFLTAMPSIELSRAVPFVDVNFQFKSDNDGAGALTSTDDKHRVPSLIKFLEGAVTAGGASKKIVQSYDKVEKGTNAKVTEIDMGIFTAPQTLVNHNLNYDSSVGSSNAIAAEIADKNRPLASLESIHIDVVASPSYTVAYKWMKMQLILHDRTRLAEIANLIRPAVYTATSLVIRYGWSHPDTSNNPYAELINQMRVEERYAIKNASYAFDDVGQVKITLELSQLGENQLWLSRISESSSYQGIQAKIEAVRDRIFNLIQDLGIPTEADTRAYQVMNFVDTSTNSDVPDKEINDKISKFISSIKSSSPGSKKGIADELAELLTGKVKDKDKDLKGLKEQLKTTVLASMQSKYKGLQDNPDPFLPDPSEDTVRYAKDLKSKITEIPKSDKKRYAVSSLAKIMTLFVLQPLRQTGKFDEVQIVYYTFNDYCGNAGGTNIGQFPVDIGVFQKVMKDQIDKKGLRDMTVAEFGKLLNDAFIADPSSIAYGMSNQYVSRTGADLPKPAPNSNIESAQDALLGKTGAGGVWKNPAVEFYLECLTKNSSQTPDRKLSSTGGNGAILRIHVYDKQSTPWDGFMKLKGALSRINSSPLKPGSNQKNTKVGPDAKKQLTDAVNSLKSNLALGGASITVDEKSGVMTLNDFNVTKIKKLVSSFVPTLTYGTNNTGVIKANLQSIQDPRLSTVNQMRQNATSTTSPNGSGVSGLPLRVIPGQIQVMMIGCPLMSINQQFFIDFGTNTDLDNFYALTGLTHTISQGKFETSAKFIWMDAYGAYENVSAQFKQLAELIKIASQ